MSSYCHIETKCEIFVTGRIHLTIPWTSLYTSPVTAVLEDVYILVSPVADRKYDATKDTARRNAIKRQILEKLENPQGQNKGGSLKGLTCIDSTQPILGQIQGLCSDKGERR